MGWHGLAMGWSWAGHGLLTISCLWAGYGLVISYGLAMGWLWASYMGWRWAGYGLAISWLSAIHQLAMGWV